MIGGDPVHSEQALGNIYFSQSIANPADVMASIAYITAGGVCERFPNAKFIFLEANGGWLVPWLERLDHHAEKFSWDVPWLTMKPSEYFRRQCWISFDADQSDAGVHRQLAALRCRPDHLGVGLSAPGRQIPGRHP